jgi:hypothetical protein
MFSSGLWVPPDAGGPITSAANVLGRRAGRIAFGAVLILGMAAQVYGALAASLAVGTVEGLTHSGLLLAATWGLALVAYAAVRLGVSVAAPAPHGDAYLRKSLVVPAVGVALALPLSIHGVGFLVVGGDFGSWVAVSLFVTGLAHLVFALTFGMRAAQLARGEARMTIRRIFLWSTCASILPIGFFVIPVILTAVTGLFVLPALHAFDTIALRERDALPILPIARTL